MGNAPSERQKSLRLIAELHDGMLDEQQVVELERMLSEDASLRSQYLDYVMLHALLETKYEPALRGATAAEVDVDSAFLERATARLGLTVESACRQVPSSGKASLSFDRSAKRLPAMRRYLGRLVTFGLLVAVAAMVMLWSRGDRNNSLSADNGYIAVLSNTKNARWLANPPGLAPARLRAGRSLQLLEGLAEVTLSSGAVVIVRGPADLQLTSPMHVKANRGTVRARVGEEATGFIIETPNADVVDLGTEFGVSVSEMGTTDVVVFEGAVDLAYHATAQTLEDSEETSEGFAPANRKRLYSGEALHVNTEGNVRRIVSIDSNLYPVSTVVNSQASYHPSVISRVSDNIRDPENAQYYQVVHGGLWEDSRAYVDRYHEWNGTKQDGIPKFLLGADYVMTFNSDKWQSNLEIDVELSCPATLYVFYDNRRTVPDWLTTAFTDTGMDIGVDEGFPNNPRMEELNGIGPGKSINVLHSIWKQSVNNPGVVTLGPLATQEIAVNMYGIAAVPLGKQEQLVPADVSATSPTSLLKTTSSFVWPRSLSSDPVRTLRKTSSQQKHFFQAVVKIGGGFGCIY